MTTGMGTSKFIKGLLASALALAAGPLVPGAHAETSKPTIVLVHGAFADSSSWNGVITILQRDGYKVIAAANPLRGVRADSDVVADIVKSVDGDVVLVGHSYGGFVISEAAVGRPNVKSLVFVAAYAPDEGETAVALTNKFPGSTLGPALAPPVNLTGGGKDFYILQAKFHAEFAPDVPVDAAKLMAAGQRPIAEAVLGEAATPPAWKSTPSWFIYGDSDRIIPPAGLAFMAARAKPKQTIVIKGASHVVMVSHAPEVAALIEKAAAAR